MSDAYYVAHSNWSTPLVLVGAAKWQTGCTVGHGWAFAVCFTLTITGPIAWNEFNWISLPCFDFKYYEYVFVLLFPVQYNFSAKCQASSTDEFFH